MPYRRFVCFACLPVENRESTLKEILNDITINFQINFYLKIIDFIFRLLILLRKYKTLLNTILITDFKQ